MFLDRSRTSSTRHLEWRVRLLGAGLILGLVGMYFEARWMVWTALAVLLGAFLLRFVDRPPAPEWEEEEEEDGGDDGDRPPEP